MLFCEYSVRLSDSVRGHVWFPSTLCSCGDTGVGKSDLMRLYSAMVNADCALVPDMLSYVKVGLKRAIKAIKARGAVPEGVLDAFYVPAAPGHGNSDQDRAWLLDTSVGGGDETARLLGLLRNSVEWAATPGLINEVRGIVGTFLSPNGTPSRYCRLALRWPPISCPCLENTRW